MHNAADRQTDRQIEQSQQADYTVVSSTYKCYAEDRGGRYAGPQLFSWLQNVSDHAPVRPGYDDNYRSNA